MKHLTKSRIAEFEQGEKRFWLSLHRPELATSLDPEVFAGGRHLGALARELVPDGVLVDDLDPAEALKKTTALLAEVARPIFEAAFLFDDVLVRTDLLLPEGNGWRLAEVKNSSSVKNYQLSDLATQVWAAKGAGLKISAASIRHVDTAFTYAGDGDFNGLLVDADVDEKLLPFVDERGNVVGRARSLAAADEPMVAMGSHCSTPFECPFTHYCGDGKPAPPAFPLSVLPGAAGKKTAAKLEADGYVDLRDVPQELVENPVERRIHEATRSGVAYHDSAAIGAVVDQWTFPRFYLDFETIAHMIPRWAGTRPYQAILFQFSCHIEDTGGALRHAGFLDLTGENPARACAEALLACIGEAGAIVTYNAPTERGCINALAAQLPDLKERLLHVADRIVDALPLVRAHYYHPQMLGSYSIKAVLPAAVPTLSYSNLEGVKDGLAAQAAYLVATAADTPTERREALRGQLSEYCALDTLAMFELVKALTA
jgi:hypothetical protein